VTGDRASLRAGYPRAVREPEIEQVAVDQQVVARLRHSIEERVERRLRGLGHLAQVGVRDHEAPGGWHGHKLRKATERRKDGKPIVGTCHPLPSFRLSAALS